MRYKHLRERLKDVGVEVTEADLRWMEKVHDYRESGAKPTVGEVFVECHEELPPDFKPSEIDDALHMGVSERSTVGPMLTTLGTLLVEPGADIPLNVDAVVQGIRDHIIDSPSKTEISSEELTEHLQETSEYPDLSKKDVEEALWHSNNLGNFYGGWTGPTNEMRCSEVRFGRGQERVFPNYLYYNGFNSLLEDRIESLRNEGDPSEVENDEMGSDSKETEERSDTAFIMMPMNPDEPRLEDVKNAIKNVCSEFGIAAIRADEVEHSRRITDVVLEHIQRCEFLVADLTHARPNVYYEVGYAHALGKRPILYRSEGADLHFDLSVHNVPEYKNITDLRKKLRKRFEAILGRKSNRQ